jgi:hypothetical protein
MNATQKPAKIPETEAKSDRVFRQLYPVLIPSFFLSMSFSAISLSSFLLVLFF